MRLSKTVSGAFCRDCLSRLFWEYTLTTFVCGWWGLISFFHTLYLLPANVIAFLSARSALRAISSHQTSAAKADAPVSQGRDVEETIHLRSLEARIGTSRNVRAGDGAILEVKVPAGVADGSVLRLLGKGEAAPSAEGRAGNLYIILRVLPDSTDASTASAARPATMAESPRVASPEDRVRSAYAALEVAPGSDINLVRASYQRLMKKYDPELHRDLPKGPGVAIELTRRLTEAYRLIEKHLLQ